MANSGLRGVLSPKALFEGKETLDLASYNKVSSFTKETLTLLGFLSNSDTFNLLSLSIFL